MLTGPVCTNIFLSWPPVDGNVDAVIYRSLSGIMSLSVMDTYILYIKIYLPVAVERFKQLSVTACYYQVE